MKSIITAVALLLSISITAQIGGQNPELKENADEALSNMLNQSPILNTFKSKAYAHVIFPKVTKAGIGIGGQHFTYKPNK